MIHIFRKEMKKWHSVLWVVFAALALSSVWSIFFRKPHIREIPIANVNGEIVRFKDYQKVLNELRMQIETYKNYAKAYGVSIDLFLNIAGLNNPKKAAFDKCVKNALIDKEKNLYNIYLNKEFFLKKLSDVLPNQLKDSVGNIDLKAYQYYLSGRYMSIPEFEKTQEKSFERQLFQDFIKSSYYVTNADAKQVYINNNAAKKFAILKFPFSVFVDMEKKKEIDEKDLKRFFNDNKEQYRVSEKRKAKYWVLNPQEYAKKIEISDETIQNFYEKNKSSLFRIPPKVKVRHIFFKVDKKMSAEEIEKILSNAKAIRNKVKENKANFADLAKKYSQDKKTALKGGLLDFFDKGTYDPEFEKAALRLKKVGELSGIVKTENGFELIQLIERISASHKPLSKVSGEIVKTIKAKRAMLMLGSNIQKLLYEVQSDPNAPEKFIKNNNLKTEETELLTLEDKNGAKLKNKLSEHLFSVRKKVGTYGTFLYEDDRVLYQVSDIQVSRIPKFNDVKNQVKQDYYKLEAKKNLKLKLKQAKSDLLSNKSTMSELAKELQLRFIETKKIKKDEEIKVMGLDKNFNEKAFILMDKKQVQTYKNKGDYFLVQLLELDLPDLKLFDSEKNKIIRDEVSSKQNSYLHGFIASLQRNARIEKYEEILKNS